MRRVAAAILLSACTVQREQLVIVVDTDAHLVGDVGARSDLSLDATIDTLRVDLLDSNNGIYATQQFVVAESTQWPVSFGIVPAANANASAVRVRLRAFRGRFAHAGVVLGSSTLDPLPEATMDRLVDLTIPKSGGGIRRVKVTLAMDCMGTVPSFASPARTCIDGATLAADPSQGVVETPDNSTRANTWSDAVERPCTLPVVAPRVCIKGGFTILGDEQLSGLQGQPETRSTPVRPAVIAPFMLDRDEYTVGRFRALLARTTAFDAPMPRDYAMFDQNYKYCTWRGPGDATNDALPLNCMEWKTAKRICELEGGDLPSEAQWEHAARGRGEQRFFPWGAKEPECCTSALSRNGPPPTAPLCPGAGPEPVGSHPSTPTCIIGDVSRDGIVDLGGNIAEAVLDSIAPYDGPCWHAKGILRDPVCQSASVHGRRGGAWQGGRSLAAGAFRNPYTESISDGVRCAYRGTP